MILILLCALALIAPATADAGLRNRSARAQAVAEAYWNQPLDRCPIVRVKRADLFTVGAAAETGYYACTIYFKRDWWALRGPAGWPRFCSTFAHEWGHLLGREHTDDPSDVMFSGSLAEATPDVCYHDP